MHKREKRKNGEMRGKKEGKRKGTSRMEKGTVKAY